MLSKKPLPAQKGVTLIEMMIAIAIVALLLGVAMPSYSMWIQNLQVRNASESILNGLQLARNEAVGRNAQVSFQMTSATGIADWTVGCVTPACPATIQNHRGTEGSTNARIGVGSTATALATAIAGGSGTPATITFTGLGRLTAAPAAGGNWRIDVTNPTLAGTRRLVIIVSPGGQTRMCDPAFALAANPQGCA